MPAAPCERRNEREDFMMCQWVRLARPVEPLTEHRSVPPIDPWNTISRVGEAGGRRAC